MYYSNKGMALSLAFLLYLSVVSVKQHEARRSNKAMTLLYDTNDDSCGKDKKQLVRR